jgi:outer membrane protein
MRYLILLFCLMVSSSVMAGDFTIATVDMQKLFKGYPGTPIAQKKFDAYTDKQKAELADSEKILEKLQKELQGTTLSDSEKQDKLKAFQDETQNFQDEKTRITNDLTEKEQEMTQTIVAKIKDIVSTIAQKDKVDLVLDANDTVDAKTAVDLTDEVLAAFKNVTVDSDDSDGFNGYNYQVKYSVKKKKVFNDSPFLCQAV